MSLRRVDFPAQLGPTIAQFSFLLTVQLRLVQNLLIAINDIDVFHDYDGLIRIFLRQPEIRLGACREAGQGQSGPHLF